MIGGMRTSPLLQKIDAVMIAVPDLGSGLRFYRDLLGHELRWRHDDIGQAGLMMPGSDTEIVLATEHDSAPNWLVASADEAAHVVVSAGGQVVTGPFASRSAVQSSSPTRSAISWSCSTCPKARIAPTATAGSPAWPGGPAHSL